ncbi:DUF3267 domain-containing protein [Paenibacillus sp. CAU 1782]
MMVWFKHLPHKSMEGSEWMPFIGSDWFRVHYMKLVYGWIAVQLSLPLWLNMGIGLPDNTPLIPLLAAIFILHEALHVGVIYSKGDISLTFRGIFFWLNTNAELSKGRFWIFMTLPFIALTVVPLAACFAVPESIRPPLLFIAWVNSVISSSDFFNSILILVKPNKAVFCRGYYRL